MFVSGFESSHLARNVSGGEMKKLLASVATICALFIVGESSVLAQRLVTPLQAGLQPLVSDFDARQNSPRLVVILSPT
jgi:hypothetical protein